MPPYDTPLQPPRQRQPFSASQKVLLTLVGLGAGLLTIVAILFTLILLLGQGDTLAQAGQLLDFVKPLLGPAALLVTTALGQYFAIGHVKENRAQGQENAALMESKVERVAEVVTGEMAQLQAEKEHKAEYDGYLSALEEIRKGNLPEYHYIPTGKPREPSRGSRGGGGSSTSPVPTDRGPYRGSSGTKGNGAAFGSALLGLEYYPPREYGAQA